MGVLDSFFKKEAANIDLSPLKKEMIKQQDRLNHLHLYSKNLHSYTSSIEESNIRHKREIIEQIKNISTWIEYLNSSNTGLKEEINELRRSFRKKLREDFESYHKILEEYLTFKLKEAEKSKESLKEEVIEELKSEIKKQLDTSNQKSIEKVVEVSEKDSYVLTNPERELLTLLFNESKPLTYDQIALKLNKSINSVRVYMNALKVKKPIIEEFVAPNGAKVFSIKNSEMVKTLFNIR